MTIGWKYGMENSANYHAKVHYPSLFLSLLTNNCIWEKTQQTGEMQKMGHS